MSNATNAIEHLVVLMLENYSFDRLLGYVPPGGTLASKPILNSYEGVQYQSVRGVKMSSTSPSVPLDDPDPLHDTGDVLQQLYGPKAPSFRGSPAGSWFLENFMAADTKTHEPAMVMAAFDHGQVPALHGLADQFLVLSRWYSAIPGPTGPNRLFALCGSSGGYYGPEHTFAKAAPLPMPSIFTSFPSTGDWRIYYDQEDEFVWPSLFGAAGRSNAYVVGQLLSDIRHGDLPRFSWVTPSYTSDGTVKGADFAPTSMHPGKGSPFAGDALAGTIYNQLLASQVWNQVALLIVFDEHGGFPDSQPPNASVPAPHVEAPFWWLADYPNPSFEFDFQSLGVRVPAILVSPWVSPGCDETLYSHSSIPATLKQQFDLSGPGPGGYLTVRDSHANNFLAGNLLSSPRHDCTAVPIPNPSGQPR